MDYLKIAQRLDYGLAVVFLIAAVVAGVQHHYGWAAMLALSSVVSYLSAKYKPAKWLLKRVMLAKLK